jgi:hypothetical protein
MYNDHLFFMFSVGTNILTLVGFSGRRPSVQVTGRRLKAKVKESGSRRYKIKLACAIFFLDVLLAILFRKHRLIPLNLFLYMQCLIVLQMCSLVCVRHVTVKHILAGKRIRYHKKVDGLGCLCISFTAS